MKKEMNKEIKPTKKFYKTFRIYADRKCRACGATIKSKKLNVKFFLVGVTENGLLKVKHSNRKSITTYHPDFFII